MRTVRDVLVAGLPTDSGHGVYPGAVALVARDGVADPTVAVGEAVRYADGQGTPLPPAERVPARPDTVYDLASLTKVFVTVVALTLVEERALDLAEPLATWYPQFGVGERRAVTVRHLMAHLSGLPAVRPLHQEAPDRTGRVRLLLDTPLLYPPGDGYTYSDLNYLILGLLCEHVSGRPLDELLDERVTGPLGLADTGYLPLRRGVPVERIAATECKDPRGMLRGTVHDENAWAFGGVAGNAGIFGTAADVARFAEMLREGGSVGGVRVLHARSVAEMVTDQLPRDLAHPFRQGLGVRLDDAGFLGPLRGFGHTGFTGTSFAVDPGRLLTVVLLTNRVHPRREWSDVGPTRREVAAAASMQ
ncbi:MAG: serine hydrolase domain-containing protein [Mycobacteriales bacterium]